MTEKSAEGRLRADVQQIIWDSRPVSIPSAEVADAVIAVMLDHAIERIEARRAKRLHVKALEGFDEALAVLAEMRGEDA